MVVRLHPHTKGHGQGGVDETGEAGSVGHGVDASLGFLNHVGVKPYLLVLVVLLAHGDPIIAHWWKWSRVICGVVPIAFVGQEDLVNHVTRSHDQGKSCEPPRT